MPYSSREERLIALLHQQTLSLSHSFDHLNRVADFGRWLAVKYGANGEVVVAAALLHDLGRSDLQARGAESARLGAVRAEPLLTQAGYTEAERQHILQAIAEHDQPGLHSSLLESRILKDADFLDGFGARGVLRSLLYSGETGGGWTEAADRLREKMPHRIAGLEFIESKRLAWQLYRFVELFLSELTATPTLAAVDYPGQLIFLEGISGSGKDTQAQLLQQALIQMGSRPGIPPWRDDPAAQQPRQVRVLNHPTSDFKALWTSWREIGGTELSATLISESFLILADRFRTTQTELLPALRAGEIVISSRSSIDVQVYQHNDSFSDAFYRYACAFEPVPDLVIYLDLDVAEAYRRTGQRVDQGGEDSRGFFAEQQETQKVHYAEVLAHYPHVRVVNANENIENVHQQILACVEDMF